METLPRKRHRTVTEKRNRKTTGLFNTFKDGVQLVGSTEDLIVVVYTRVFLYANEGGSKEGRTPEAPEKYWGQRYHLFSRFDEGIQLDTESWYSVTHELIAQYIAKHCKSAVTVLDAFAGVGGNSISFAKYCHVLAVDIDNEKLRMLENNAKIYNREANIECVCRDFLEYKNEGEIDALFASPPWGGPGYKVSKVFDLYSMEPPLQEILAHACRITGNIALYLPKTIDPLQFIELLRSLPGVLNKVEFQVFYLNNKAKGICCYIGELVKADSMCIAKLLLLRFSPESTDSLFLKSIQLSQELDSNPFNEVLTQLINEHF